MNTMPTQPTEAPPLNDATRLAYERTYLAHERTQMAWVRTALSLISFGFTMSKFFEYLHGQSGEAAPLLGAQNVGVLMVAIGLVGLAMSMVQHGRALHTLRARCPGLPRSESMLMALAIIVLGLLALVSGLTRI